MTPKEQAVVDAATAVTEDNTPATRQALQAAVADLKSPEPMSTLVGRVRSVIPVGVWVLGDQTIGVLDQDNIIKAVVAAVQFLRQDMSVRSSTVEL